MADEAIAKVRYRIGEHELEVEGPPLFVDRHVERWAKLTGLALAGEPAAPPDDPVGPLQQPLFAATPARTITLADLFTFDPSRNLVATRILSPGRRRNPDAALVILYGYRLLLPQAPLVSSALFKSAFAASGCRVTRLDKVLERHLAEGLIRKTGSRKRELFTLTVSGEQRAAALVREFCGPNRALVDAKTVVASE